MRARNLESYVQVGVFALFLGLPMVDGCFDLDRSRPTVREKDVAPAPAPPRTLAALAAFPDAFDAYYRDHFGWRDWLTHRFRRLNFRLFRVSETPSVHVGRDGWLFYGRVASRFHVANEPFPSGEQDLWIETIRRRHHWLADEGIRSMLVVAPNKHSIYPEFLPAKLVRTGAETRWETVARRLERESRVTVVDLHRPLLSAKGDDLLYERAGTHWNARGAYVAYRAIFERLAEWFPQLEPVEWEQLELNEPAYAPDLSRMLSVGDLFRAERAKVSGGVRHVRLRFRSNGTLETFQDDPGLPRAVIFHDSFAMDLAPLLAEHFSHAVFRWSTRFDARLVREVDPHVVIEERVERQFVRAAFANAIPPSELDR